MFFNNTTTANGKGPKECAIVQYGWIVEKGKHDTKIIDLMLDGFDGLSVNGKEL